VGSHESRHLFMKIPRSRIKGLVKIVAVGFEHAAKIQELKIKNALPAAFDFGESGAADVRTGKLEFGRKLFLRPSASVPQLSNLRAYDIPAPHPARTTQAPVAKGQLALSRFVSKWT
jgi:hypothetical protein